MAKAPSDFNDLHAIAGLDAVRQQLLAALNTQPLDEVKPEPTLSASSTSLDPSAPPGDAPPLDAYVDDAAALAPAPPDAADAPLASPHPSLGEALRFSLAELLGRFSLAMPDGKIWDAKEARFIKKGAAKDWWGERMFRMWQVHPDRAQVNQNDVMAFAAAAQLRGRGGLADALNRYVYIYPTDTAWDVKLRERVPVSALKLAIADVFDGWIKHPTRRDINAAQLVFDPGGPLDREGVINTFRGLPLEPPAGELLELEKGCANIRALVYHLCENDEAIYWWVMKWLAYPLQHVGAKMASALLLHSDINGSGKSLLFEEIIKPMYGDYGATLGQHQLESQYTDWRSQVLFALFEEIFSGSTKFSHTGQIKQMITGKTQRIEKKYVAGWEEANHMNGVFLSNETQPFPLDPTDRRFLVLWPRSKLEDGLKDRVLEERANGGVEVFLAYLLRLDLGDFHTHTWPAMTEAKQDLIDYSRYGWDLFHRDWKLGHTEWPYQTCLLTDLYTCYKRWCSSSGERDITLNKFSANISKRERRRKDLDYGIGYAGLKKGVFIIVGAPPDDTNQGKWLGECVVEFRRHLKPDANPA